MRAIMILTLLPALALELSGASVPQGRGNPDYERTIDRRFDIGRGVPIQVDHALGSVRVEAWNQGQVRLVARIEARGEQAREVGEKITVAVDAGNPFSLRTKYPEGKWKDTSYGVSLEIRVPRAHALRLAASFGDATVKGINAAVDARVASGNLAVSGVRGKLSLEGTFGSIRLQDSTGSARVQGSSGNIRVSNLLQGGLVLRNSFGNVEVRKVQGDVEAEVASGEIRLHGVDGSAMLKGSFGRHTVEDVRGNLEVRGGSLSVSASRIGGTTHVETTFGSIDLRDALGDSCLKTESGPISARAIRGSLQVGVRFSSAIVQGIQGDCEVTAHSGNVSIARVEGDVRVANSFGTIQVDGVGGDLQARNKSGNIDVRGVRYAKARGQSGTEIDCATSFGNLTIALPAPPSCRLEARAGFGEIHSEYRIPDLKRDISVQEAACTLGDGTGRVKLVNESGSIYIRKR